MIKIPIYSKEGKKIGEIILTDLEWMKLDYSEDNYFKKILKREKMNE